MRRPVGPEGLPLAKLAVYFRPLRPGLIAMVAMDASGALIGLFPAIALGSLVNVFANHGHLARGVFIACLIGLAIALETLTNIASDGLYAKNASRLCRDLRIAMFEGARLLVSKDEISGVASRFTSDADSLAVVVSVLDTGSMLVVEFIAAVVALGLLSPWALPVAVVAFVVTWALARWTQEPFAVASEVRQEELELMTRAITNELDGRAPGEHGFADAAGRLMSAESRLGWLQALNIQGSGGLAKLGPVAAVVAGALTGTREAGTLVSVYLVAQRIFTSFDGIVDLRLELSAIRGAAARCFALIGLFPSAMVELADGSDLGGPVYPAS